MEPELDTAKFLAGMRAYNDLYAQKMRVPKMRGSWLYKWKLRFPMDIGWKRIGLGVVFGGIYVTVSLYVAYAVVVTFYKMVAH